MKNLTHLLLIATISLLSLNAHAQQDWSFEFRAGANLPIDDLGDIKLDAGAGFEGTAAYAFTPALAVYGGWGWHQFDAEAQNSDPDVEQTGYVLGLQYTNTFPSSALGYRLRSGLTYEHIEIEDDDGDIVFDTDHGVGFELGGALSFALSDSWSLTPGLRYRYLSRDVEFGTNDGDADLSYIALDVGVLWAL